MSVIDHLSDLRKRIIFTLIILLIMLAASLSFISLIYDYLVHPVTKLGYRLMVISPGEVVTVYLSVAGIVAICLTLPFAFYQLWRFVAPGLTPMERKYSLRLLPIVSIMFAAGIAFAWFFIFPNILRFLLSLSAQHFSVFLRAGSYFSFLSSICLPFGLIFELPVVVVFLTRMGLITPRVLNRARRYAYVTIVILGVLISPPELVSHLSVVLPMMALYELSILLSALTMRHRVTVPHLN
ncbi:twin-arginine translocase subunit TatC [Alicyclobacillus curvatus]|nr:twin-arginine translocase subunit TatC [Alicyclobacillus curvatus]